MITLVKTSITYLRNYMATPTSESPNPQLAFLGPLGTYSHQAAFDCFGDSVTYFARPTIADVQQTLSVAVPFGLIPQENSNNGSVIETYNILRSSSIGQDIFVRGVTVLSIKHCLVIRRGVRLENIENVLSHEQALGQCRTWLAKHLPNASLIPTDSTASAAKRLLSAEPSGLDPNKSAAICSSVVTTIYSGLQVLAESIQDAIQNFTRFYVLSWGQDIELPTGCNLEQQNTALLRLEVHPDNPEGPTLHICNVIGGLSLDILRIDRRPSYHGRPFNGVYFLEVGPSPEVTSAQRPWTAELQQEVERVKRMGVNATVLGCW